jgi:TonB-linked SusC/RagA family outer membrane protein
MEKKITSDSTVVHSLFQVFNINGSKVLLSICLMLIAVFVSAHAVLAQGRTVSGTVTEAGGEGLPGVNIMIKGTGSGTVTDVNGKYSVEVSSENDVLVFSFVGYLTQEMTVGNQRIINVELPASQAALDEIVVIGYGTRKKSSVTSSVTRLENRGLEQIPDSRVENVLAGRLAGVNISNARSRPGEAPNIRVRGLGSISAGNNPLIVVDGFPGGDLGTLNMNDVESIEVLKDASAAAIYGSRGASGVILVTTKRGKEGKTSLNVNSYFGISKAMLFNDWLTGKEWYDYLARYQNREFVWAGGDPKLPMFGDAARPDAYKVNPLTYELPQTIWQDEVMQTGRMQSYNVSASGGSDKGKYYVSGVYQDEEGSMKTANYRKIGVRANVDMKINSFINMGMELSPSYTKRRLAGSNMVNLVKYPQIIFHSGTLVRQVLMFTYMVPRILLPPLITSVVHFWIFALQKV